MTYQTLTACILATVGTVLMAFSKTSLLYLWTLKSTVPLNQWYATLSLVLVVPEVTSVLRTLWGGTLLVSGTLSQWPAIPVILLGVVTTVMESAAMTFFTLEVASSLPPYAALPLMHALLLLQILLNQLAALRKSHQTLDLRQQEKKKKRSSAKSLILGCVLAGLGLGLAVAVAVLTSLWELLHVPQALGLLASLLTLALVWCRPVRQRVFCCSGTSSSSFSLPTRQNMTLLLGSVRVVSVLGCCVLVTKLGVEGDHLGEVGEFLWTGLRQAHDTRSLLWGGVVHCLTTTAAYLLTRLGAYYDATRSSMLVPASVSTVVASVLFALHCTDVIQVDVGLAVCSVSRSHLVVFIVSVIIWLIPFLTLRKSYFAPSDVLFRPEMETFLSMNYNGVCLDQNLFLDYNPFSVTFGESSRVGSKQTRVFICTTMYREADYEMKKLLRSLSKISSSQKLKEANVYLESHIFLDNAVEDLKLKEFAQQLMSLVETSLTVSREESVVHKAPYGIQIRCVLPGGMPMFLHLKDPSLVKAKKRWSQIMYMKYILEYRTKSTNVRTSYMSTDSVCVDVNRKGRGERARKNEEILLQISQLLKGLKHDRSQTRLDLPDVTAVSLTGSRRDISEQASDEGIDGCDGISFMSDVSSQKGQSLRPPDDKTHGQCSSHSAMMTQSSSYGSLASSDFLQGKDNPVYISDEEEDSLPGPFPNLAGKFSGAFITNDVVRGEGFLQSGVFCISDDLQDKGADCTSIQLEVPQDTQNTQDSQDSQDKNTYILATDADMRFNDNAVLDVVNICNEDLSLGGVCGRTYPVGKKVNPIVWHQIFEYAKDFWMIKSAQNVVGSVMCCPGCFSLYRTQAVQDVVRHYSQPTTCPRDVFAKETGEDRWICTLMMLCGWTLRYSTYAANRTYCPDNLSEFFKQRRRWILSDFANTFIVFRNLPRLVRSNHCFSLVYTLYLAQLLFIAIFLPGTTLVMLTVGMEMLIGVPYHLAMPGLALLVLLYGGSCCTLSPRVQIRITKVAAVVFGLCMTAVVIGAGIYMLIDLLKALSQGAQLLVEHYMLLSVVVSVVYAALLHPREGHLLVFGLAYLFYFPTMHMLLPIYAVCNIIDQSWGTREGQKPKVPKLLCFPRLRRRKNKKKGSQTPPSDSGENPAEDPGEAVVDQTQALAPGEESFWGHLIAQLIGKDVNLGLNNDQLTSKLRSLRRKMALVFLACNLLWVVALSVFLLWFSRSADGKSNISSFGILIGVMNAFTFVIQIVGMTVYRLQDGFHRLGKRIYGAEKPHYIRCADQRSKQT